MKIYEYWKFRPRLHPNDAADYLFAVIAMDEGQADRIFEKMEGDAFDNDFYCRRERSDMCGMVFNPLGSFGSLA